MLEKHDVSSKMQNVLIKGDRTCSGLQFTFSLRRVVLCARPCTCDAGMASWNSVYDVVIPCLHFVIDLVPVLLKPGLGVETAYYGKRHELEKTTVYIHIDIHIYMY